MIHFIESDAFGGILVGLVAGIIVTLALNIFLGPSDQKFENNKLRQRLIVAGFQGFVANPTSRAWGSDMAHTICSMAEDVVLAADVAAHIRREIDKGRKP